MKAFRSCPVCRGSGRVEIECARCHGKGSIDDVRAATKAVLVAWQDYVKAADGSQERLVDALGTLKETVGA